MNRITKAGVGLLVLGAGALAPIVPEDMELLVSYQYPVEAYQEFLKVGVGTSSEAIKNPQTPFEDTDGNGIISVSAFANRKGEAVFVQIDDTRYNDMGGKKEEGRGYARNPKKAELVSLIEATTPRAEAAIAFDAATTATGSGTSITYSHTVSATANSMLITCSDSNESSTSNTIISGVTYNSVSLTQTDQQEDSLGYDVFMHYLLAPSTGANNVVVSRSSSGSVMSAAMSYTGVNQTTFPNTGTNKAQVGATTVTMSITTANSNSWIVACGERHRGWTAGAATTLRATEGVGTIASSDSNGTKSVGANTMVATQSDSTASAYIIKEIGEFIAATVIVPPQVILFE